MREVLEYDCISQCSEGMSVKETHGLSQLSYSVNVESKQF